MTADLISNFYAKGEDSSEAEPEAESTHDSFTPINDMVMLRRIIVDNSTKGSFLIPERYRQQSNKGEVLAVGEKVSNLKAGDRVLFGDYNSEHFSLDGDDFLLVRLGDVRGVERIK